MTGECQTTNRGDYDDVSSDALAVMQCNAMQCNLDPILEIVFSYYTMLVTKTNYCPCCCPLSFIGRKRRRPTTSR